MPTDDTTALKKATKTGKGFTDEERAAMKERAKEQRARSSAGKVDGEQEVLDKIAEMSAADREMAQRIHAVVKAAAPELAPRTWYGMPAYAKDGQIICFFQPAAKFRTRYSTLGFSDKAHLDEGAMWPAAYALTSLTETEEAMIVTLIRKAVG